ncbi:unnamed protein product [Rhizoctonia solani]|uniref:Uncharacterized protein n=1 Tax=Rhizoctonia solani TaxID=456999 RepID=A0A8H3APL4_9AGAM|nr:unnamed protein product [Rhizoctonia solani]
MSSHAHDAEPERVGYCVHQTDSDDVSINHYATYAPSYANYVFPPNYGHANPPAFPVQLGHVHPGSSAADVNADPGSQLEDFGLLDSLNTSNAPSFPGTVSTDTNLAHISRANPTSTTAILGFYEAVDEDDIQAERILTGAPPTQHGFLRSRFCPNPIPVFDSSHRSPVSAPTYPVASRRGPSIPIPIFDVAPTVELPPSRNTSQTSITFSREELDAYFPIINDMSFGLRPLTTRGSSSVPNSPGFGGITRVSPRDVHHPRPVASHTPSWARAESLATASYTGLSISRSVSLGLEASTSYVLPNHSLVRATSTPSWVYTEESFSFSTDDFHIQAANDTSLGQCSYSVADPLGPQPVLHYPSEEPLEAPSTGNAFPPGISLQSLTDFPFTFNHNRTGTLPPHPPGYAPWRYGMTHWSQPLVCANTSFPPADGPSHPQGTNFDSFEYSTLGSDTKSSESITEIIGNRSEPSPFGPAIHPEPYQGPSAPVTTNEPGHPVRVRPFSNVLIPRGAQTSTLSPLLTEHDTSVDESTPSTPSPRSSVPVLGYSLVTGVNAYSHQNELRSFFIVTPENTLPPMGFPENPREVTLPSIAQLFDQPETGVLESIDENQESEAVEGSEWPSAVDGGACLEEVNEKKSDEVVQGQVLEEVDESEGSEAGHEGDDEDETDNEDEYDQYFSFGEDEFSDLEDAYYAQRPQSSGSSYSIIGDSGASSSPLIVDYYSDTDGSAYADDGYLGYTTDDDAQ